MSQQQWHFFPEGSTPPSRDELNSWLDSNNPHGPYYNFIGNSKAVTKLQRIDFKALGRHNHCTNDLNVALVGRAGSGKTELARRHNRARKLPFVKISPKGIKNISDIFEEMKRVCANVKLPLMEVKTKQYCPPPLDLFIDEVHALTPQIVNGLLTATEHDDSTMVTEKGIRINCRNIHWIIATTDRGKLFDAFDTRFNKVIVNLYSKEDIARIVHANNSAWNMEICQKVAHYCSRVPREALAFAREMDLEFTRNPANLLEIADKVAEDNEIDKYGLTYQRLSILKALGDGPVAEKRLPIIAGVKAEELDKFILPWLLEATEDQKPYIQVSQRGYELTETGIFELDKRKISHNYGVSKVKFNG